MYRDPEPLPLWAKVLIGLVLTICVLALAFLPGPPS